MIELDEHIQKLSSPDESERIYAAEDIGYANSPEGVSPLFARLPSETSTAVREAIFSGLQNIEGDAVTEGAISLLASEDSFLRNQAVELLRQRGPAVIPFLKRAFVQVDEDGRKFIIDVLAGLDGAGSSEIYALALTDRDVNVTITALESLGNAGKTEFREEAERLAASSNPMLAGAALETLAQIGNEQSLQVVQSAAAVRPLADFLLPSYLKLLGAHGGASALTEAVGMLDSRGAHLHAPLLGAIAMLHQRHPATLLPDSLVESLKTMVQNSDSSSVRQQALRLLNGLTRTEGVASFLAEYPEPDLDSPELGKAS